MENSKTKLFITRHGATEYTEKGIWTGQIDVDLSPKGVAQATELGETLNRFDFRFDLIICSSRKRSIDTAKLVLAQLSYNPKLKEFEELCEMSHGDVDGLTNQQFKDQFPEIQDAWKRDEDVRFPNGENFEDVDIRIMPIINQVLKSNQGKNILFVGHKSVNLVLIGHFMNVPFAWRYVPLQDTCHLNLFKEQGGKMRLKYLNMPPKALVKVI